ncbi:MAG: Tetratricopeptide repeat-containing protein [Candidatus Nitrotoga sp. SPKER]|nr:MAG: Tetratricopeptide repeat-containing protein [Candidatus Nitrotoga sp. SPKER]
MTASPTLSSSDTQRFVKEFNQENLIETLNEWRKHKSVGGAADLLNFSHIPSAIPFLMEPAEYVASLNEPTSKIIKEISRGILNAEKLSEENSRIKTVLRPRDLYYQEASQLKKNIQINPKNAVALVDLARIYSALGQNEKAKKAILTAINLFPNHTFALRSAARFFIQIDEAELALRFINNSPRTLHDPWLLASKLSIEELLGRQHKQFNTARAMSESDRISPYQLGELRGAIASIMIASGDIKQSKKIFNRALVNPNDNVIAQAIWVSQKYGININIREDWFNGPFSSEALYYQKHIEGDFEKAKDAAISWFFDEPFSPRPLRAATFVLLILGDAELSEQYALDALLLDPEDTELRNNLVCALAFQNKIEESIIHLHKVCLLEYRKSNAISGHTLANLGMIHYRTGKFQEAEEYYRKALEWFDNKSGEAKSIALSFMAREAFIMKTPNAQELINEAFDMVKKSNSKAGQKILASIKMNLATDDPPALTQSSMHSNFSFDLAQNIITIKKSHLVHK